MVFKNEVLSVQSLQTLKYSFVYLLRLETKLSIVDGPSTLVAFIDWLECADEAVFCIVRVFCAV